ncbi:polymorphic toxin-type HINT domain-containing protein [Pelistega sp. MC2]|uniref:polymorphic toxin-type HINT domain-containing protein n=1 Tax=Pelistega sp. MC2 TaxID=1720297 RepID=UPI00210D56BB|nr:polymorphic toxin-type HINT domain-containing protein [Pelistega sp. MC2]
MGWRKASLLEKGMVLLNREGLPYLTVLDQYSTGQLETVYNIKVEDFSTYHIGHLGVWVHNANCCDFVNTYGDIEKKFIEGGWVDKTTGKVQYLDPFDGVRKDFPDGARASVDHILPRAEFKEIPGFERLPENVQRELLNDPLNLQPLPKELNASKGNKVETGTDGWRMYVKEGKEISPEYLSYLEKRQAFIKKKVEQEIKQRGVR